MALANTASLETNFNVDPYYDDFDETKNFHRVLFRPGLAVQARELTQMQTIQQNQIDRFAEHVFQEGTTVSGLTLTKESLPYVKIRDNSANGASANAASFVNTLITGATSGISAVVIDSKDGSEAGSPNTKTLYIRYASGGSNTTAVSFTSGEQLTSNSGISCNVVTEGVQSTNVTGDALRVKFSEGVIFAKDHFIRVPASNTIVGRYTKTPDNKVGFEINESIVRSSVDGTLLDPAQGAYNYAAPGADRLKLNPVISVRDLTDTSTSKFIEKVRISNGLIIENNSKPEYAIINDYIARRTSDESGDYIVNGMTVKILEHLKSGDNGGVFAAGGTSLYGISTNGNTNLLVAQIQPGKSYVQGFEIEFLAAQNQAVDKGIDVESAEQISVPANYGNYIVVDNVTGVWDLNEHSTVNLYDSPFNAISNNTLSSSSTAGRTIKGTARVRALEYSSGTKASAAGQYNMYLYDINMTGNTFNSVQGIHYNDSTYDGFADAVQVNANTVLKETNFNRALFGLGAKAVKRIRDSSGAIDNEFRILKTRDVTIQSDGTVTVTSGEASETFPYTVSANLNDTQERENFYVVLKATANSASAIDTGADRVQSSNVITGLTSVTTKYNVGDVLKLQGDANTYIVSNLTSSTSVNVYGPGSGDALTNSTVFKAFQPGQVISLNGVGGDAAERTVTVDSTTQVTIDIKETLGSTVDARVHTELKRIDGEEKDKAIQKNRYVEINVSDGFASAALTGPWNLGLSDGHKLREVRLKTGNSFFTTTTEGTDVTKFFLLDTGQTDNLYNHSKLKLKPGASHTIANGNVYLVKFDYFTHSTAAGRGYFSVDSYPIDDANTANTTAITTANIPVHTSPVTGVEYDLRDYIDIRARVTDTANSVTSLTNISRNPSTSTSLDSSGGLRYMAPNEDFISDYEYYLPRKDRLSVDKNGRFTITRGTSSLNPQTPAPPSGALTLATISIPPYPSLPMENAKKITNAGQPKGRANLGVKIDQPRQVRYTMRDIGVLKQRIENLEYYTTLNALEQDAKNFQVSDNAGLNRFKNGILVDNFTGHGVGNTEDDDYKISVDPQKFEIRPTFKLDDVSISIQTANSTNISAQSRDAVITISDTSKSVANGSTITQGAASGTLTYQVDQKLYIENITGTFTTSANLLGPGGFQVDASNVTSVATPDASKLITLPYTHTALIENPNATDTRNTAGAFWKFPGKLTLSPETDYWTDTVNTPDVIINIDNNADNWERLANAWGTQFGNWNTIWSGSWSSGSQIITQTTERRTGTTATISPGVIGPQQSLGEIVRDVSVVPFMRSRVINVTGQGLKPNARHYFFFDGIDVNSYVRPANSSFANTANEGGAVATDASGNLYALFRIPNDDDLRFRVGSLPLTVTASPTNSESIEGGTPSTAVGNYSSSGLIQEKSESVISTRSVNIDFRVINETRTTQSSSQQFNIPDDGSFDGADGGGPDPIAQSFSFISRTDGTTTTAGGFLSKVDLFFESKDATRNLFVYIKEVDPSGSFITNKKVPFSQLTIPASDINISSDGSKPTQVIFPTPIYLSSEREYAIVVEPENNNPNLVAWVSRLGEDDRITGNRVTKQPLLGTLMVSSNSRQWNVVQQEDLKIKMYFANFGTNQTGTAIFKNDPKEFLTIANTTSGAFSVVGETVHGETTLTMDSATSANVGLSVLGLTSGANGVVTFNSGATIRIKDVTVPTKFSNGELVRVMFANGSPTATQNALSSQATPTGIVDFYDFENFANTKLHLASPTGTFVTNTQVKGQKDSGTGVILSIDNLNIDVFKNHFSRLQLDGTTVTTSAKLATSSTAKDSSFFNINENDDTTLSSRKFVLSRTTENANLSGDGSAEIKVVLTNSSNKFVSPAIDNDRSALFTIENLVNNDSTNENGKSGGNALARYITKTITLAEGQDAEDLKVLLTAYKPATASVLVYYKILHVEDGDEFEDRSWRVMTQDTSTLEVSDSENLEDFREYEYSIPTGDLTGPLGEVQYTNSESIVYTGFKYYAIKIVLLSSTYSRVPRVKNFRAIALQI